jgi:hypothetical protein
VDETHIAVWKCDRNTGSDSESTHRRDYGIDSCTQIGAGVTGLGVRRLKAWLGD